MYADNYGMMPELYRRIQMRRHFTEAVRNALEGLDLPHVRKTLSYMMSVLPAKKLNIVASIGAAEFARRGWEG